MKMRSPKKETPQENKPPVANGKLKGVYSVQDRQLHRSFAIYGRSGSGKTTFSATFPKPILLLDVKDKGTDSIAEHEDIDVKEIMSLEDVEDVYYFLKDNDYYKTVVFDTITQLQQVLMDGIGKKNKRPGDWGSLTRQEFGEVSGLMKDWIINFRDLPMEVVFLAQERVTAQEEVENPDQMITPEIGPHTMPSVAIALNAAVSVIGNTFVRMRRYNKKIDGKDIEKEEAQYCLRVGPSPVYITKLRKPKSVEAPNWITDPTYDDIINAMKGD